MTPEEIAVLAMLLLSKPYEPAKLTGAKRTITDDDLKCSEFSYFSPTETVPDQTMVVINNKNDDKTSDGGITGRRRKIILIFHDHEVQHVGESVPIPNPPETCEHHALLSLKTFGAISEIDAREYLRHLWEKHYYCATDGNVYKTKIHPWCSAVLDNLCISAPTIRSKLHNFFMAGPTRRDFVQLRYVKGRVGDRCSFCHVVSADGCSRKFHCFQQTHATDRVREYNINSCTACHDVFKRVIDVYDHIWLVSMPLRSSDAYQGFQCNASTSTVYNHDTYDITSLAKHPTPDLNALIARLFRQ